LLHDFQKAFPHFNLEDKVSLKGEGNVRRIQLTAEVENDKGSRRSNRAKETTTNR